MRAVIDELTPERPNRQLLKRPLYSWGSTLLESRFSQAKSSQAAPKTDMDAARCVHNFNHPDENRDLIYTVQQKTDTDVEYTKWKKWFLSDEETERK